MILLVHPPVVKPGEAPAGLAKLAGALRYHAVPHRIIDANLEGILYLLNGGRITLADNDTWTKRAVRHRDRHLASLRSWEPYRHPDRYRRAVADLSRVLAREVDSARFRLNLANYEDMNLSPVRSFDLLAAAESYRGNPFYPYFQSRLLSLFEKDSPEVIGFSLNYLSQALCAFAMIGFMRQIDPSVKIILGGGLIGSWKKRLMDRNPFNGLVDALIDGPGEEPLLAMSGKWPAETLPGPDYQAFPLKDYLAPGTVIPYSASRGCYWRKCSFCPETTEGNRYDPTPVIRTVKELETLVTHHNPALVHFLDNALSPALLQTLVKSGLKAPWYGFVRIAEHLADEAFCRDLKKAGCVMLKLGLESGSQRVLDRLHKGIDLKVASGALRALRAAGIASYVYLLFGTPAETPEDARQTLEFVVCHAEAIDFLNVAVFNLPIDSAEGLETRLFYDGDLSLYEDFIHPQGWNRSMVRHFLDREFKRHPAIMPILKNDPPVFTSNHAPFFVMGNQSF